MKHELKTIMKIFQLICLNSTNNKKDLSNSNIEVMKYSRFHCLSKTNLIKYILTIPNVEILLLTCK